MADTVAKLKDLLFDREAETLSELSRRIEALAEADKRITEAHGAAQSATSQTLSAMDQETRAARTTVADQLAELQRRTGSPEAMRKSVAEILDDAIVDVRETRQEPLSRALAPMVVKTIKAELKNNQQEMIDVLYPITGQLVKAYVASAMRDMMNQMNRRLEMNPVMLRFRSIASGYSMAELALAETQQLEVEELYLIRRGSGELLQRWPQMAARTNSDIHMSGVLSAINDFSAQAFKSDGGNLRSFDLDEFKVFLRASPVYLLAAKCRGTAISGVESLIDRAFLDTVSGQHQIEGAAAGGEILGPRLLSDLKSKLEDGILAKHEQVSRAGLPFNPLKALAGIAALVLVTAGGWYAWTSYEAAATRTVALAAIEETAPLKGFPVIVDVGYRGRTLGLSGLAPSEEARDQLIGRIRGGLPSVELRQTGLAVLPASAPDVRPQIAEVRRDLSGLQTNVRRDLTELETDISGAGLLRALDRATRRLEQSRADLALLAARPDARQRGVAGIAQADVEAMIGELAVRRQALASAGKDRSRQGELREPLVAAGGKLRGVAASLATLVGDAGRPSGNTVRPPSTAGTTAEAAEEVSLAAERVATIAAAAAQVVSLPLPQPPEIVPPTPREQLQAFVRDNAIFFANADDYRAAKEVDAILEQLIRLMRQSTDVIRVVGYTDERGGPGSLRNNQLAQSRADKVVQALLARGIPKDRMSAIGRSTGPDLSASVGPLSPNRRVEFEIGFKGETATSP